MDNPILVSESGLFLSLGLGVKKWMDISAIKVKGLEVLSSGEQIKPSGGAHFDSLALPPSSVVDDT